MPTCGSCGSTNVQWVHGNNTYYCNRCGKSWYA